MHTENINSNISIDIQFSISVTKACPQVCVSLCRFPVRVVMLERWRGFGEQYYLALHRTTWTQSLEEPKAN